MGAMGPAGPAGPTGATGATGANGISGGSGTSLLGTVFIDQCNNTIMRTQPITVTASAKIFGTGRGSYIRNATNLQSGILHLELRDATDTLVASTAVAIGSLFGADDGRIPISIAEILLAGGTDYIAAPGTYTLKLIASASDGTCAGSPILSSSALSFLLVGTS